MNNHVLNHRSCPTWITASLCVVPVALLMQACGSNLTQSSHRTASALSQRSSAGATPPAPAQSPAPVLSSSISLHDQVDRLEQRIESSFRLAALDGAIPNVIYTQPGDPVTAVTSVNVDDSALFTGVYLGAQCLKYSQTAGASDRAALLARIESLLATLETDAKVTGVPGLIARYSYVLGTPGFPDLTQQSNVCPGNALVAGSGAYLNRMWCGETSRDQYSGYLFGMSTCLQLIEEPDLKVRIADTIRTLAKNIMNNGWKIPYGQYESDWGSFNARSMADNSLISLATAGIWSADVLLKYGQNTSADVSDLIQLEADLTTSLMTAYSNLPVRMIIEAPFTYRYYDYFNVNLTLLNLYPTLNYGSDATRKKQLSSYLYNTIWRYGWMDNNALLTFVKVATLGLGQYPGIPTESTPIDETSAINAARQATLALAFRDRSDVKPAGASGKSCLEDAGAANFKALAQALSAKISNPSLADFANDQIQLQCTDPVAITDRDFYHYYWEATPYRIPTFQYSAAAYAAGVDTIVAYWLGRASGQIRAGE